MLLTAHGGALGTGRNSKLYFDTIYKHKVDVIEVDVRKRGKYLYIAHLPVLFLSRHLTLSYVFDYIKEHNFKVNCDLKERNMVKLVIDLAREKGVLDKLIFTGAVRPHDLQDLTEGEVYVNNCFYAPIRPTIDNLPLIKEKLEKSGSKHIAGLNLSYRYCTDEFISRAKELNIPLSIYTVDDIGQLRRILNWNVANVTTNKVIDAIKILGELNG